MATTRASRDVVQVDGRTLTLTHLDKVLYPETGTTKAEVLAYLAAVAGPLVAHAAHRPATRKRWVHGTGGPVFFQKNLEDSAPAWVHRRPLQHSDHVSTYPLVDDLATLTWLGQVGALEIHVPQWRFGRTGSPRPPDRLVLDLDPGPGAGLAECAQVARWAREILTGMGLDPLPVTSGSAGLHLYAALDGTQDSAAVSAVAHELARVLEADHPDLVVSSMKKSVRTGKVLVDWSQNSRNKTTIAPYSLRGLARPTVAAPRTWAELDDPDLAQLAPAEVTERLLRDGDLLAGLLAGGLAGLEPTPQRLATFEAAEPTDRLATYRAKRDAARTPEPVPTPEEHAHDRSSGASGGPGTELPTYVIQDHHARAHHHDLRLERDGVLVSWALPKGEPTDPAQNRLGVQTEDHPLAYADFAGTIPAGEYGAGTVTIWDAGTYETLKWREDEEVIVVLHSSGAGGVDRGSRQLAFIRTRGGESASSWLVHLMVGRPQRAGRTGRTARPAPERPAPERPAAGPVDPTADPAPPAAPAALLTPMLASPGSVGDLDRIEAEGGWALEMKWDGVRALVSVRAGVVTAQSRNGVDLTATYPELAALADCVADDLVVDGEIVALDAAGRPDFGRLQARMNLTQEREVARARAAQPVQLMVFDLLEVAGHRTTGLDYDARRSALGDLVTPGAGIQVPPAFTSEPREAVRTSLELGLEGVVAKRRSSTYAPGRRSPAWVKIKHLRAQDVVVVGWRTGRGARSATLASLLVAVPDDAGRLRYAGRVGSGFGDRALVRLRADLEALATEHPEVEDVPEADAVDAHWVRPERVGEVTFAEWTGSGRLRHPVWRGWRPDVGPDEVTRSAG